MILLFVTDLTLINSGIENLYGIDYGNVRMIFNYGLTDNVTLGFASSTYKVIDGSLKTKLINQGKNNFPLTISTYSIISFDTLTSLFSNKKKYEIILAIQTNYF